MKRFLRVNKHQLYLKKPSPKTIGLWWKDHLLMQGGYEEIENKYHELVDDNPESTVAIGYEE